MPIQPYLNFGGNCREVVEFYAEVFNIEKPQMMTFGDMPSNDGFPMDEQTKKLIMHANLTVYGTTIMLSDVPPGMPLTEGNNFSLNINIDNLEEIKAIFASLKEGGTVTMDLQETFWSKCYGFLIDKFGIGWMFNYQGNS